MSHTNPPLEIDIRPATESDLDLLHQTFEPHNALNYHRHRHAVQRAEAGVYLIAWHGDLPVGHFLLRWDGPGEDPTGRYPGHTPGLEAGATLPAFQRHGVATRMIETGEQLARERGLTRIGLAVGSTDNPAARRLYERLGYRDWGGGEFTIQWEYETLDGQRGTESEICIYLFKDL